MLLQRLPSRQENEGHDGEPHRDSGTPVHRLARHRHYRQRCSLPSAARHSSSYCSTCVIPKLNRYSPLYAQSLSEGTFRLAVIVSSPHGEARHICHQVGLHHFDFPVYVDLENEFDLLNPSIPSDRRFHGFLTDSLGRPRFIGDPTASEHLMKIFNEVLKSEDKTK